MRCAVFAATRRGVESAIRLRDGLLPDAVDIFLKDGREEDVPAKHFSKLVDAVAEAFQQYDALIFFMAAGIAVRMIAPHLKSKLTDPAVLVADERGGHIISLLSGHVGGGNSLTRRVADCLGGIPIITTATDVNGLISPDALATELGLRPVPKPMIQDMSGALLDGKDVL
ncbi:MAG: cobalamin biosynthesis protein CbiG, partial [Schwartzia sp.]|nr:cobalamin biosynthesis protein CbiG [Schwartzia sp. (in: firmicutes)]